MKPFLCLAACTVLLLTACQRPATAETGKSTAEETRHRPVAGFLGAEPSSPAQEVSARQAAGVQAAAGPRVTGGNAPARRLLDPPFKSTEVARFKEPWAMTFLPDGRLLVTEKTGPPALVDVATGADRRNQRRAGSGLRRAGRLRRRGAASAVRQQRLVYLSYAEAGDGDTRGAAVARAKLNLDASGGGACPTCR